MPAIQRDAIRGEPQLVVRMYHDGDRPAVVEMLHAAYEHWPVIEGAPEPIDPDAFFEWKHAGSPFGRSQMLVADSDGDVVGFRAFMPWLLLATGAEVRAIRGADAVTRPGLQRAGVFGRIRRAADDLLPEPADLYFGTPNRKSLGATMKLPGRAVVGDLQPWMQLRPWRFGRSIVRSELRERPPVEAPVAAAGLRDMRAIDDLLHDVVRGESRLQTARDVSYLRWRCELAPLDYRTLSLERAGRLEGLAVFRLRRRHQAWEAIVEELLVRPGDRAAAGRLLAGVASSAPVAMVSYLPPPATAGRTAARRRGFIPWRGSLPLMIKQPETGFAPPPERPQSWALGLGDIEIF